MDIGTIVKDFLDYNFKSNRTIGQISTYYIDWRKWEDYKKIFNVDYASIFEYDTVEIFLVVDHKRDKGYLMIVNNDSFLLEEPLKYDIYLRSAYNDQGYMVSAAEGVRLYKEIKSRAQKIKVIEVR